MVAVTANRSTPERAGRELNLDVAANAVIFQGALVALTAAGFLTKGAVATTLTAVGRAAERVTGGATDGAVQCRVEMGVYRWANSAAGDLITRADVGKDCYIVDDQTVAKTSGTNTRSIAGKVVEVDAQGVWVRSGF